MDQHLATIRDEVFRRNPGEGEFHQAVTEVFESLGPVSRSTPSSSKAPSSSGSASRNGRSSSASRGRTTPAASRSTAASGWSSTPRWAPTRVACASTPRSTWASSSSSASSRSSRTALTGMPIGGGKGGSDFDPRGTLGRRNHALLPVLHDRAVPPHRRVHRRAGRATSASAAAKSATSSASTSGSPTATSPASSPARASPGAVRWCGPRPPATAP